MSEHKMKRSKKLRLDLMSKQTAAKVTVTPMALAIAASLAGCSSNEEQAQVVKSVADCVQNTSYTEEQCKVAYENALAESERTAPKYDSVSACESEFGANQCHQSSSGGWFMPFMAGYLVSSALDSFSRDRHYSPVYVYGGSGYNNGYVMTGNGSVVGRPGDRYVNVSRDTLNKPLPTVNKTISRGGFGSQAAAKSNWGGGSRRSSWGG